MSYVPINWNELPASDFAATRLTADNFNHMDQGIKRTHAEVLTTTERDALTGADLFTGRIIFNRTVERFEIYISTPPTSAAAFSTAGWFRLPTFFDVVQSSGNQTIAGVKTFSDPINGTLALIGAKVHRNQSDFSVQSNSLTLIPWTAEDFDSNNMHSTTSNPTRLTVPVTGFYQVNMNVTWVGSFSGPFDLRLRRNGSDIPIHSIGRPQTNPSDEFTHSVSDIISCTAGQFFEVQVRTQNGANDILGPFWQTNFSMYRVGG